MTDSIVITHSDIEDFLRCRRLFWWAYIKDYRPREVEWGPMPLGSRVHRSLEAMYRMGTDPIAEHERLAHADVTAAASRSPAAWEMDQLYNDIIEGRNCIAAFMEWVEDTGPDDGLDVVAVEEMIEAPILDGRVLLRGKVDVKYERTSDGAVMLNDWKTAGAKRSGTRERLERSYQHHVYLAIEQMLHPDAWIVGAYYTILRKVKDRSRATVPLVERFAVPVSPRRALTKLHQIEHICEEMMFMMEGLVATEAVAYPTPDESCRWCDYKLPCELQDDNPVAAEAMLNDLYVRGRRHARYRPVVE
jgi:RecB family exonuclease